MAQTIGTNIVTDGEELYKVFTNIQSLLDKMYDYKKKSHYAQMLEELGKYVSQGGVINFKLVQGKFAQAIEEKLDEQEICYTKMPDGDGNTAFIVKDTDAQAFMEIQKDVFSVSSDYAMTADMESILNTSRSNIVTLDFQGENQDLLTMMAQQKLYQCGIVSCNPDFDSKTYVNDASLFDEKGLGDLADFEMKYALEQAMESELLKQACGGVNLLKVRLAEAECDNKQVEAFINSKENFVLANSENPDAKLYLSHEGKKFYKNERVNGNWIKSEIEFSSGEELKARIQFLQDNIYNMSAIPMEVYDPFQRGDKQKLNQSFCKRANITRDSGVTRGSNAQIVRQFAGRVIDETLMKQVSQQALETMKHRNLGRLTQLEKYQMRKQTMASLLKNGENPAVIDFLNKPLLDMDGNEILDRAGKQQWLDEIIARFEDTSAREKNGVIVDTVTHAEVEKLVEEDRRRKETAQSMDMGRTGSGPDLDGGRSGGMEHTAPVRE